MLRSRVSLGTSLLVRSPPPSIKEHEFILPRLPPWAETSICSNATMSDTSGIDLNISQEEFGREDASIIFSEAEKFKIEKDYSSVAVSPGMVNIGRRKKKVKFDMSSLLPLTSPSVCEVACQTDDTLMPHKRHLTTPVKTTTPQSAPSSPYLPGTPCTPAAVLRAKNVELKKKMKDQEEWLNDWRQEMDSLREYQKLEIKALEESFEGKVQVMSEKGASVEPSVEMSEFHKEITTLKKSLSDYEQLLLDANRELSLSVHNAGDLQRQLETLTEENIYLSSLQQEVQDLRSENEALKKDLELKDSQVKQCANERSDFDMMMELALEKQKQKENYLQKNLEEAWKDLAAYENGDVEEIKKRRQRVTTDEQSTMQANNYDSVREELVKAKEEAENMRTQMLEILEELERKNKDNEKLHKEVTNLQNYLTQVLSEQGSDGIQALKEEIEDLKDKLERTNDMSPHEVVEKDCVSSPPDSVWEMRDGGSGGGGIGSTAAPSQEFNRVLTETIQALEESICMSTPGRHSFGSYPDSLAMQDLEVIRPMVETLKAGLTALQEHIQLMEQQQQETAHTTEHCLQITAEMEREMNTWRTQESLLGDYILYCPSVYPSNHYEPHTDRTLEEACSLLKVEYEAKMKEQLRILETRGRLNSTKAESLYLSFSQESDPLSDLVRQSEKQQDTSLGISFLSAGSRSCTMEVEELRGQLELLTQENNELLDQIRELQGLDCVQGSTRTSPPSTSNKSSASQYEVKSGVKQSQELDCSTKTLHANQSMSISLSCEEEEEEMKDLNQLANQPSEPPLSLADELREAGMKLSMMDDTFETSVLMPISIQSPNTRTMNQLQEQVAALEEENVILQETVCKLEHSLKQLKEKETEAVMDEMKELKSADILSEESKSNEKIQVRESWNDETRFELEPKVQIFEEELSCKHTTEEDVQSMRLMVRKLEEEREVLQKSLDDMKLIVEEVCSLRWQVTSLKDERNDLETEVVYMQGEVDRLTQQIESSSTDRQNERLVEGETFECKEAEETNKMQTQKKKPNGDDYECKLELELIEANEKIKLLKEELEEIHVGREETNDLVGKINVLENIKINTQQKLDEGKEEIKRLREELKKMHIDINESEEGKIKELEEIKIKNQQELDEAKEEVKRLKDLEKMHIDIKEAKIKELEEIKIKNQQELDEAKEGIKRLREELEKMHIHIKERSEVEAKYKELIEINGKNQQELGETKEEIKILKEGLDKIHINIAKPSDLEQNMHEIETAKYEIKALREQTETTNITSKEKAQVKSEVTKLDKQNKELEAARDMIQNLERKIKSVSASYQDELAQKENDLEMIITNFTAKEEKFESTEERLKDTINELEEVRRALSEKESKLFKLERYKEETEERKVEMSDIVSELGKMKDIVSKKDIELEELRKSSIELEELKLLISKKDVELEDLKKQNKDLAVCKGDTIQITELELKEALVNKEMELHNINLILEKLKVEMKNTVSKEAFLDLEGRFIEVQQAYEDLQNMSQKDLSETRESLQKITEKYEECLEDHKRALEAGEEKGLMLRCAEEERERLRLSLEGEMVRLQDEIESLKLNYDEKLHKVESEMKEKFEKERVNMIIKFNSDCDTMVANHQQEMSCVLKQKDREIDALILKIESLKEEHEAAIQGHKEERKSLKERLESEVRKHEEEKENMKQIYERDLSDFKTKKELGASEQCAIEQKLDDLEKLKDELETKRKECVRLQDTVENLKIILDKRQEELKQLLSEHQSELVFYMDSLKEKEKDLKNLENETSKKNEVIHKLTTDLSSKDHSLHRLQKDLEKAQHEFSVKDSELQKVLANIEKETEMKVEIQEDLERLRNEYKEVCTDRMEMSNAMKVLKERNDALTRDCSNLRTQLKNLMKELETERSKIEEEQCEIYALEAKEQKLNEELEVERSKVKEQQDEIYHLESKERKLKKELEAERSKVKEQQHEICNLEGKEQKLKEELEIQRSKVEGKQHEINTLEAEEQKLKVELEVERSAVEEKQREIYILEAREQKLKVELEVERSAVEKKQREIYHLQAEECKLKEALYHMKVEETNSSEEDIETKAVENLSEEIKRYRLDIYGKEREIDILTEKLANKTKNVEKLAKQLQNLHNKFEEKSKEESQTSSKCEALTEELERYKTRVEHMDELSGKLCLTEDRILSLGESKEEKHGMSLSVNKSQQKKEIVTSENKVTGEMLVHQGETSELRDKLSAAVRENNELKFRMRAMEAPHVKKIEALKKELEISERKYSRLQGQLRRQQEMLGADNTICELTGQSSMQKERVCVSSEPDSSAGSTMVAQIMVMELRNKLEHAERDKKQMEQDAKVMQQHVDHYYGKAKEWKEKALKEEHAREKVKEELNQAYTELKKYSTKAEELSNKLERQKFELGHQREVIHRMEKEREDGKTDQQQQPSSSLKSSPLLLHSSAEVTPMTEMPGSKEPLLQRTGPRDGTFKYTPTDPSETLKSIISVGEVTEKKKEQNPNDRQTNRLLSSHNAPLPPKTRVERLPFMQDVQPKDSGAKDELPMWKARKENKDYSKYKLPPNAKNKQGDNCPTQ